MNWFIENWDKLVVAILVVGAFVFYVWQQRKNVKTWLKWAVAQAEKELGEKTGQLKLQMVYDMAVSRFKWIATFISFDTFSAWVDDALVWLDKQLDTNPQVNEIIKGQ